MDFSDIKGVVSTEDLNSITFKTSSQSLIVVRFNCNDIEFTDEYEPSQGKIDIFGLGDYLAAVSNGTAVKFSLFIYIKGSLPQIDSNSYREAVAVTSKLHLVNPALPEIKGKFLAATNKMVVPVGAPVSLSIIGYEEEAVLNSNISILPVMNGEAAQYDFNIPDAPGLHVVTAGEAKFYFFASCMQNPVQIYCRNLFNAPQYLYCDGNFKLVNARSASVAKVGGSQTEFDINSYSEVEVSAIGITQMQMTHFSALPLAREFKINGLECSIDELKTEHSHNATEAYNIKINAALDIPFVGALDFYSKIFTTQYKSQFS